MVDRSYRYLPFESASRFDERKKKERTLRRNNAFDVTIKNPFLRVYNIINNRLFLIKTGDSHWSISRCIRFLRNIWKYIKNWNRIFEMRYIINARKWAVAVAIFALNELVRGYTLWWAARSIAFQKKKRFLSSEQWTHRRWSVLHRLHSDTCFGVFISLWLCFNFASVRNSSCVM